MTAMANEQTPKSASPLQVAKAVLWSFLGIRGARRMSRRDAAETGAGDHRRPHRSPRFSY